MNIYELLLKEKENIFIYAEGGAGKTTQLVSAYKKLLADANGKIIPIYIPLREYDGSANFVKEYILSNYFVDVTANKEKLKPLFAGFDGKIILLLDGLNESSYGKGICKEIQEISEWKNVQVLLTSRHDDKNYFRNFQRFSLLKMDNEFVKEKISDYDVLDQQLKDLLLSPFYFTRYNQITDDSSKKKIQNAGQLLELFYKDAVNRITLPERREYSEMIAFGFVPFLCFKMSLTADLEISEDTAGAIFDEWDTALTKRQKLKVEKDGVLRYDYIETVLGISICKEKQGGLSFHELSRDFFAAYYEKDRVQIIDGKEWAEAANGNILSLVASLNGKDYGTVIVPKGTKSVFDEAFTWGTLKEIILPDSIRSIGMGSFFDCSNLKKINVPSSVTSIGNAAFFGCRSLVTINIPNSVTCINDLAFDNCSSLEIVNIPNSVTSIGNFAFTRCSSLETIDIPNSVASIGMFVFSDCSNLKRVNLANGVTSISDFIFNKCGNLKIINIPNCVTSIGRAAFYDCESLETINIPDSVTNIGNEAFDRCSSLVTVNIPNSVTSIGEFTFCRCSNLETVNIPDGVTSIGNFAFSDCKSLKTINTLDSVTSIGNCAFGGCSSLKSINIPDGITNIGEKTFLGCSNFESLSIPNSVTSIGELAFAGCSNLERINIPNSVTSIDEFAFFGCSNLTIKCHDGSFAHRYAKENGIRFVLI